MEKIIDPGAEFSKPRSEKLDQLIDRIDRLPERTLAPGEGAILVAEIRRLLLENDNMRAQLALEKGVDESLRVELAAAKQAACGLGEPTQESPK